MSSHILNQSDDSDAPDDVSFGAGRAHALEASRAQKEQVGRLKKKQKERRRHLDQQYKEQKRKKLEALARSRLPEDLLQSLDDEKERAENGDGGEKDKTGDEAEELRLAEDEAEELMLAGSDGEGSGSDDEGDTEEEDAADKCEDSPAYIPLSSGGGVEVVSIEEEVKKSLSSAERAAAFRQGMLYGRHIVRESVQKKVSKMIKKKKRKRKP